MKSSLQFVAFVCIVIGGFWVGMQWGNSAREKSYPAKNPIIPEVPVTPVTVVPVIVPTEDASMSEVSPSPVVTVNTTVDPNLPTKITDKINHYSNSNFRYGFDLPANVYYAGFGAENGARHTVGISKEDPETLADAAVRVYFYGKKVVPELQNAQNGKAVDPAGQYVYILLDGEYSVKIEAMNINHPVVQKILETIQVF